MKTGPRKPTGRLAPTTSASAARPVGTGFEYDRDVLLAMSGPAWGFVDVWGIQDDGLDNLGKDRRMVEPEKNFRGRVLWNHRQELSNNYTLSAELGCICGQ